MGVAASPAFAQEPAATSAPEVTTTTAAPTTPGSTTAEPAKPATPAELRPDTAEAAPGTYSSPRWLPLRRDLPGGEVTVGCTLDSHGSQFGYECSGHHDRWAIDFLADTGTPVFAAGAGFATNLTGRPGGSGFGNVISIDHGFGVTTLYAHLSEAFVPGEGMWVDENTLLGKVGETGSASAPHLHFEEFANPGGSNSNDPRSVDPGPLFACRGDLLVSFPQVAGFDSWARLPWGSLTVASDGDACAGDPTPNDLVPASGASAASAPVAADPDPWWTHVLGPLLDLVGSTGQRLPLPT
ncbi:MAG: Peptidase [Ilumatobacteraceae bacterium]|nr:Peptidase [Ilumatobacteraceae bacterium]